MAKNTLHWYAIKLSKDALQPVIRKIGYHGPLGGRYIVPITRGKLTIQNSMDELSIDLYIPWETKQITHHRSKKCVDRDFPLIPGYAFVRCEPQQCYQVSNAKGVSCVMSEPQADGSRAPQIISDKDVFDIQFAEYAIHLEHVARNSPLTQKRLSERYKHGQQLKLKSASALGKVGTVSAATGRKTVKTTIEMFGTMVPAEISVNLVDVA